MEKRPHPVLDSTRTVPVLFFGSVLTVFLSTLVPLLTGGDRSSTLRLSVLCVVVLLLLLAVYSPSFRRWIGAGLIRIRFHWEPPRAKVLVVMVSRGRGKGSARDAALYHLKTLEHLWLITSETAEGEAKWVKAELKAAKETLDVKPILFLDDVFSVELAKEKVEEAWRKSRKLAGVRTEDIVCDCTGMTTQASAGMILACAEKGIRLQYMRPSEVDENGHAIPDAGSKPMEVEVSDALRLR